MTDLKLDILVVPTYNTKTMGIADASRYPNDMSGIMSPTIEITIPGFGRKIFPFSIDNFTIYSSSTLELTEVGDEDVPLPDGVYFLKYSIAPAYINFVEKSIIRVDVLQEKFDEAFMHLDFMDSNRSIKMQTKVDLDTVYYFIQGAIAAANNGAVDEASKLYTQADKMLTNIIGNNCGYSENNYITNFSINGNM
jgi:hypothetical protein